MPPMCFRNKYITPNLSPYSICLDCPDKTPCTTAILDEPGFEYVDPSDKTDTLFTVEEVIQHENMAADAARDKVLDKLDFWVKQQPYHVVGYTDLLKEKIQQLRQKAGE
jgi:hypothetical protein